MCDSLHNFSGLRYLWKQRGNQNYSLKDFISKDSFIQNLVFEDTRNGQKVLGKIVTSPKEGEAYHWPRLQHENLAPLIDIVSINEMISVYIYPFIGSTLKNVIHDPGFLNDPNCFDRKKAYAEDILWALDYLHEKSLCLMNLTDAILYVCDASDKAVICDFSCTTLAERATKDKMDLPIFYKAPELSTNEYFDSTASEMWTCGVMMLQIFTKHVLPFSFIGDEVNQVLKSVKEINYNTIQETNPGANLEFIVVEDLKGFLGLFLAENPKLRVNAKNAAISPFLANSRRASVTEKYSRKLLESDKHFGYPWPSYQTNLKRNDETKKDLAFKEIYLKEAEKCRDNLRKLPGSNKFINLHFLQKGDISKNLDNKYRKVSTWNKNELGTHYIPVKDADCIISKNTANLSDKSEKDYFNKIPNTLENSLVLDKQFDTSNVRGKCKTIEDTTPDYEQNRNLNNLSYPEIPGDCNISYGKRNAEKSKFPLNVSPDSLSILSNLESQKLISNGSNNSGEFRTFAQSFESNNNEREARIIESQNATSQDPKRYIADKMSGKSKSIEKSRKTLVLSFRISNINKAQSQSVPLVNPYTDDSKICDTTFNPNALDSFHDNTDTNQKFQEIPNNFIEKSVRFNSNSKKSCEITNPQKYNSINKSTTPTKYSDSNIQEHQTLINNLDSTVKLESTEEQNARHSGGSRSRDQAHYSLTRVHSHEQEILPGMENSSSKIVIPEQHSNLRSCTIESELAELQGIKTYSKTFALNDSDDCESQAVKCTNSIENNSESSQSGFQIDDSFTIIHSEEHVTLPEMENKSIEKHQQHWNIKESTEEQNTEKYMTCEENSNIEFPSQVSKCANAVKIYSGGSENLVQMTDIETLSKELAILTKMRKYSTIEKDCDQYLNTNSCTIKEKSTEHDIKQNSLICEENVKVVCPSQVSCTNMTKSDFTGSESGVQINHSFTEMHSEKQATLQKMGDDSLVERHHNKYTNIRSCTIEAVSTEDKGMRIHPEIREENNFDCSSQESKCTQTMKSYAVGSLGGDQIDVSFAQRHSDEQTVLPEMQNNLNIQVNHDCIAKLESIKHQAMKPNSETFAENVNIDCSCEVLKCRNTMKSESQVSQVGVQSTEDFIPIHPADHATSSEMGIYSNIEKHHHDQHLNISSYIIKEESADEQDIKLNTKTFAENAECVSMIESKAGSSESSVQINCYEQEMLPKMRNNSNIEKYHDQNSNISSCTIKETTGEQGIKLKTCTEKGNNYPIPVISKSAEDQGVKSNLEEDGNVNCLSQVSYSKNTEERDSGGSCDVKINDSSTQTHSDAQEVLSELGDECNNQKYYDQHSNSGSSEIKVESTEEHGKMYPQTCGENDVKGPFRVSKGINTMEGNSAGFETRFRTYCSLSQTYSFERYVLPKVGSGIKRESYHDHSNIRSSTMKLESTEKQDVNPSSGTCEEICNVDYQNGLSQRTDMMECDFEGSHGVRKYCSFSRSNSYEEAISYGIRNDRRQQIETPKEANVSLSNEKFTAINLPNEPETSNTINNEWKIYRNAVSTEGERQVPDNIALSSIETPILNFPRRIASTFSLLNLVKNPTQPSQKKSKSFIRSKWFPFLCLGKKPKKKIEYKK